MNFGYTKSSSKTNSHNESAVVTTIKGKDENSSITYNNVNNIEYVGTQAQNTKFIYNNVDNITKKAVELKNSYSSSSTSSGISTGVTIGYGDGTQTSVDAVKVSASQSKMNSNGTTYQNGRFVNVDEVHNNTKNMTLSGFNQEGGTVTGNIENLTIESKQNTSTTKGSTKGGSLGVSANGLPSGSANYSKTNGERRVVDNASTFIVGDESDLKVAKLENTAAAIGTTENGKLSIDEYEGHNLENVDKLKTAGGSVGVSTSGITSIGVNYSDKKQEGITKNTVIGNVEIEKSSGDEINRDLDTMTEITEDRDFKTNINVESQTINYIKNPEKFKEDLQKAKNEVEDLGDAVKNTSNPLGKDKRNIFSNLRAQRWSTSFYNVIGSRVEELARQFKAREINEEDLKEALRDIVKGYGKDIGIDFDVVYLDESTMPKDSKGSTGSSYIVDRKNRKVLIPIDVNKIEDIKKVLGTLTEEVAHGKDALEGRQDKKVAEDKSNDEEGLESLGRPANEYVKKRFGEDNNSKIKLTTDGIDLSNADVGEKVGDVTTSEDRKYREKDKRELFFDSIVDIYKEDIENRIRNIQNEKNTSEYLKIYIEKGGDTLLSEMSKVFEGVGSNFSKKLFVVYGAPDEIRKLYINKEKNVKGEDIDMFILDKHMPESVRTLWLAQETSENLDKVSNYLASKLDTKNSLSISLENREKHKTMAEPDFTYNKEFYAFGKTRLYQSVYGNINRLENGKYDVDITVVFQYTDRFEDVKNIDNLPFAKQGKNKEFKGGRSFSFRTEPKEVTIKKTISNLDEITGLLKNRLKGIDDNSELGKYNIKGDYYE